jgi:putative glutamine amidotransferase
MARTLTRRSGLLGGSSTSRRSRSRTPPTGAARPGDYGPDVAHSVEVEPGSLLAEALGVTLLEVPSYHHQAADELGRELRAVAWSPAGVVEGIEAVNRGFVIGIQWHAQAETPENGRLFRSFVKAATRHSAARSDAEPVYA